MTEAAPSAHAPDPSPGFAHEVLHGAWLAQQLLEAAMLSADGLRKHYPKLERAIESAESAVFDLYQIAGEVWHAESTRSEAQDAG